MNYNRIKKLQKEYGVDEMQLLIDNGSAWTLEGAFGRYAMNLLKSGACMLPKTYNLDVYGNIIPSRDVIKAGSRGSYKNSKQFWTGVWDGSIDFFVD